MKNIFLIIILSLIISSYSYSDEIIDCDQFEKLKDKVECKAQNLKTKLNEQQAKVKANIENIDETETANKIKKTTFGQKLLKFKNSKTGAEFFKDE
tara:strand:+ start:185 stop:472 length:288 start_codon:yes stop_codon:yes gene_type:complete